MSASILRNGWLWVVAASVWAAACGSSNGHGGSSGTRGGSAGAPQAGSGGSSGGGTGGNAGSMAGSSGSATGGSAGSSMAGESGHGDSGASGDTGTAATAGDGAPGGAGSGNENGGTGGTNAQTGEAGMGGEAATGPLPQTDKVDLLLVVDNSISMFEKQKLLAAAVPKLVLRLVDPWCTGGDDPPAASGPGHTCPSGRHLESEPVNDLHVGVITTSLGAHGSHDVCSEEQNVLNEMQVPGSRKDYDDKGQLLPLARPALSLPSWDGKGFLNWDPLHQSSPVGQDDSGDFIADLVTVVSAVKAQGCGYESTLEAMYRFLVDPEPPKVVDRDSSNRTLVSTDPDNTDTELLDQRDAFLRPDSALVILTLSDEDDCSISDANGGQGWLAAYKGGIPTSTLYHLPRARAACAEDPNDPCCAPCPATPTGCESDPVCDTPSLTTIEDTINLRCFEQRRRFGVDFLYRLDRYVDGLTASRVPARSGGTVPNPLYAEGRDKRLVIYMPIVGVPWQDLAKDPSDDEHLDLMTAKELRDNGHWPALVGDFDAFEPPTDPFMVPSIEPRTGLVPNENPFTDDPIVAGDSLDPLATINGHEQLVNPTYPADLQFACIFRLTSPVDCSGTPDECDCPSDAEIQNSPLCQEPGGDGTFGTTQYFAKAYPGVRHLEVARRVGDMAQPASICPRNTTSSGADDYGYSPAMRALQARISAFLGAP